MNNLFKSTLLSSFALSFSLMGALAHAADSESRTVAANVNKIKLQGPISIILSQSATPSIKLVGDKAAFAAVVTTANKNALEINATGDLPADAKVSIEIGLPNLAELEMNGSGSANISGFKGDKLKLDVNGSGSLNLQASYKQPDITLKGSGSLAATLPGTKALNLTMTGSGSTTLSGTGDKAKIILAGSGSLEAQKFEVKDLNLGSTGSGNAEVFAKSNADVILKGSGSATVYGKTPVHNGLARGSGTINWK
jgi:hypothetical protein